MQLQVTKCDFHKYGPSGTMQHFDIMCIMGLNVINEKIYAILWFWFAFLCITTVFELILLVLAVILHSRSIWFNKIMFGNNHFSRQELLLVVRFSTFSDWMFLYLLSKNVYGKTFAEIISHIASKLSPFSVEAIKKKFDDTESLLEEKPSLI